MPILNTLAALQMPVDLSAHDLHLIMIFVFFIMVALAIQAAGLVVVAVFAAKLMHKVEGITKRVEDQTKPILDKVDALLGSVSPKIATITTNVEQMSYSVREKVEELSATVSELNDTVKQVNLRTRVQIDRVDGIVTDALVATDDISRSVQHGIRVPITQVAGLVAGVKAAVETLIARSPLGRRNETSPYDL